MSVPSVPRRSRSRTAPATAALLVAGAVTAPAGTEATPFVLTDRGPMGFHEAERVLRAPLAIASATHNPKSDTASTFLIRTPDRLEAKLRIVADLRASGRNEDSKLVVAAYVVSRLLFPDGGIIPPTVLRPIDVERLVPHVDPDAVARLRKWAVAGEVWAAATLQGQGTTRAELSPWYGGHVFPRPDVPASLPPELLRQLGNMNVLAILVHNGDLHGDNWEIRHEDGACFIVDSGLTFLEDGYIPTHHLWRDAKSPMAAAIPASTIARVRALCDRPGVVHRALADLQGTRWGLPVEARAVVLRQALELLASLHALEPAEMSASELMQRIESGELRPYRDREGMNQRMVVVTDW